MNNGSDNPVADEPDNIFGDGDRVNIQNTEQGIQNEPQDQRQARGGDRIDMVILPKVFFDLLRKSKFVCVG